MVFSLGSVGRYTSAAFCFVALTVSCVFAQSAPPVQQKDDVAKTLLPKSFAGWAETGSSMAATNAANADVLNEYGLKEDSVSSYHRGSSHANLRAMRFADATGAYGAYTFFRKPGMIPQMIGSGGACDAHEIVFWSGTTLVDATFDSPVSQMIFALKALPLPAAGGITGVAPSLPDYLPSGSLDRSTMRYAIGPAAYMRGGGVLPPSVINFSRDAEVVTAQYATSRGHGTLTLIEYPTPQMAIASEKMLSDLLKGTLPATLQQSSPAALGVHRSGPLVAVTSGDFSAAEAQALLAQVKYQADVTWNRGNVSGNANEVRNAGKMLLGIAYLFAVLAGCAIALGFFLGGGRALWRVMHGKPVSTVYEEDFISLNLSDWPPDSAPRLP